MPGVLPHWQHPACPDLSADDWRKTNPRFTGENFMAPIPGTKRAARVEENTAADRIALSARQIERLNHLTLAVGDRHNEANIAVIDR